MLRRLQHDLAPHPEPPVWLFTLRSLTDAKNTRHLNKLPRRLYVFYAIDGPNEPLAMPYYSDMLVDPTLILKVGMQVILHKNYSSSLVNSSVGKVVSFHTEVELLALGNNHVQFTDGLIHLIDPALLPSLSSTGQDMFPIVLFKTHNGPQYIFCRPEIFQVKDQHGQIITMHTQVPCPFFLCSSC